MTKSQMPTILRNGGSMFRALYLKVLTSNVHQSIKLFSNISLIRNFYSTLFSPVIQNGSCIRRCIVSTISSMLSARTSQQLRRVGVSEEKLETIHERLKSIQVSVDDVSHRSGWTKPVTEWLTKVNRLTILVENTIDEHDFELLRKKNRVFKKTSFFELFLNFRIGDKVDKIFTLLDELQKEATLLGLGRKNGATLSTPFNRNVSVRENDITNNFVGRSDDVSNIAHKLRSRSSYTAAIVGMAGIGKSTVAAKIYLNEAPGRPFTKKFWVKVGGLLDETRMLKEMLESLTHEMPSSSDPEDTWSKLLEAIRRERVLLVLDDVRSVSQEQFVHLLYRLQRDGAKISVLVTTRRIETARTINANYTHDLQGLSDVDSWTLFNRVISHSIVSEMQTVGKQIVQKCHGVPLVIRKMASLLQNIEDVSEWESMAGGELWDLPNFRIMSTLSLTYDRLPKALKRCFAYCCIFPKHAIIRKSDLIRLWLAQGFLPEETVKSSIETGEKFFDILLNESLLQVREHDEDGNVVYCTMRDLAHDLAMYFSRHDVSIKDDQRDRQCHQTDVRHLVFSSSHYRNKAVTEISHPARLRTIYSMGAVRAVPENLPHPMVAELETLLSQAKYLYVLILDGIGLKEVPKSLEKLKYLRYLDLSNNPIKYVPESIAHLYLLQTLLFRNCDKLENTEKPPKGIDNLTYLSFSEASPKQLSLKSSALKMQPPIKLGENGGSLKISQLRDLTDIAGPLCISGLEYVMDKEAAQEARIGKKHGLSALELHWSKERPEAANSQHNQDEDVLNGLQPHSNIRRLKLINYDSEQFPMWMMNMKGEDNERLYRLVKIELVECKRCLKVPTMGQLPCLRNLLIAGMDNIESMGDELYKYADDSEDRDALKVYFPALRRLELRDLRGLKIWQPAPTCDRMDCRAFLNLETLEVVNCPVLTSTPTAFPCLKSLLIQSIKRDHWLDSIIANSCRDQTLTSLVLCRVTNLALPQELVRCTSLEELRLLKCPDFKQWPNDSWNLSSLKELCIDGCSSLNYLPRVDSLTALNALVIRGCGNLRAVPISLESCTSLTKLAISNCSKLQVIPNLQTLANLEELDIIDCVMIKSWPAGLHDLFNLRIMRVSDLCNHFDQFPQCNSLETLWLLGTEKTKYIPHQLKDFTQLKVLRVKKFGELKKVPSWICELKDLEILIFEECDLLEIFPLQETMLRLIKLRCLRIEKCAILENISDHEWKKICHVPHIKIRGNWHQGDRSFLLQESPPVGESAEQAVGDDNEFAEQADARPAPSHEKRSSLCFNFTVFCVLMSIVISLQLYWTTSE